MIFNRQHTKLLPGKTPVGTILSQISGQYFSGLFKDRDRFFPAILRIVEFYLRKDSNYGQNRKGVSRWSIYFPLPAGRDSNFPRQIRIGTEFFPSPGACKVLKSILGTK